MAGCTNENWTLQDLSTALQDMHKDNKKIVVPMFQRGKRWTKSQERTFIDSLIKGYPVGTMLFYETFENNKRTYILVDGLQRGNSIKKFMKNPTEFFYDESISDEFCASILELLNHNDQKFYSSIRTVLTAFIKEQKTFKNLQFYTIAKQLVDDFKAKSELIGDLINIIKIFFEDRQDLYDRISSTVIPVIVYTGDEDNLPDIFERINSKGTPLDQYEIYAAAWPVNQKHTIRNAEIIELIMRKYDLFIEDGYYIHGYSREEMRSKKQVNTFEYLFGLSKYLVRKYDVLGFNKNLADDTVNPLAFELVNACLNDTDRIKSLYKNLETLDLDAFETSLCNTIDFVINAISVVTKFKGNSRNSNKIFHSKYQILSMISTTFKEMYDGGDCFQLSDTWANRKQILTKNLMQYYVYDIITNYWSEGGTGKIHAASKPNRYMIEISGRAWMVALDSFFEKSMLRAETKNFANPRSEEYVLLNCIYLKTFTAMDQLSIDKFDVEHIAPKDQMRKIINECNGEGLPVSCIANLCYLPEYVNRSKKSNNFYQDKKYLHYVKLEEIESKYSFTDADDLEWMDIPYDKPEDFAVLKEYYTEYCTKRFDKMKHLFCNSLGIIYENVEHLEKNVESIIIPKQIGNQEKPTRFTDKCVLRLARELDKELVKVGRSTYTTIDSSQGFVITTSKAYRQGKREKYWFAYRKNPLLEIERCPEQFIVYGCNDENTLLCIPVSKIEEQIEGLNISRDEDNNITHWHIVFFKSDEGVMTWLISKPTIQEVNIDEFII